MANEVTVLELGQPRLSNAPLRKMPPIDRQVLSIGGAVSAAFERSTTIISVYSTTACNIDIRETPASGTAFPLPAGVWHDFDVSPNHKVQVFA